MDIQKIARKQINPAIPQSLRIEYVDVASLAHWPRNPRRHDDPAILASVREFGFRDPIGVNLTTNEIEEGHGRLDCLLAMKEHGESAPPFVEDRNGSWLVPTLPFTDDRQTQERYALAHNRTQELGAYDDKALATLLSDLSSQDALPGTGFDQGDLDALVAGLGNALLADQKDSTVVPVEIRLSVPPRVWLTMQQEIQDAIVAAVQPFGVECTWPD